MYIDHVKAIIEQDDNSEAAIQSFIAEAEKVFSFSDFIENNLRFKLWNSLYAIASATADEEVKANCFSALRILSREKILLDELFAARDWLSLLKKSIGLDNLKKEFTDKSKLVAIEAGKCLCNLVFNCYKAGEECIDKGIIFKINDRIKLYRKRSYPDEIKLFDIKLIFIITALRPETRKLLGQKKAIYNLIEFLDIIVKEEGPLKDKSVELARETLKALFNLTVQKIPKHNQIDEYVKLIHILRKFLIMPVESDQKRLSLHNDVVNLLTNISSAFYPDLVPSVSSCELKNEEVKLEYSGHEVSAFKEILELLKIKLSVDNPVGRQLEVLSPIATLLYKAASAVKIIRKYLRSEILPPLKDIYSRPEEGTSLRNCLCRLLTTPITQLRQIVAEFLFVLCKKSVKRMIKYTGYGNAAGLLAQRGLLAGREDNEAKEFSSDSEDSETEEYAENKHKINPVLGCYEPEHHDAMAGMTEEQKEYEAMKMVELMDALTRTGTIKPCRIDENGKPVPIEHVLELQNSINNNNDMCNETED